MRTPTEIEDARRKVAEEYLRTDISSQQRLVISGMSVALCWAAGVEGTTLEEFLKGRKIAACCDKAPAGWICTRTPGHEGPCAAVPTFKPFEV